MSNTPDCTCGATYTTHRCGYTYDDCRAMLWVGEATDASVRYATRGDVLALMASIKRHTWTEAHEGCRVEAEVALADDATSFDVALYEAEAAALVEVTDDLVIETTDIIVPTIAPTITAWLTTMHAAAADEAQIDEVVATAAALTTLLAPLAPPVLVALPREPALTTAARVIAAVVVLLATWSASTIRTALRLTGRALVAVGTLLGRRVGAPLVERYMVRAMAQRLAAHAPAPLPRGRQHRAMQPAADVEQAPPAKRSRRAKGTPAQGVRLTW